MSGIDFFNALASVAPSLLLEDGSEPRTGGSAHRWVSLGASNASIHAARARRLGKGPASGCTTGRRLTRPTYEQRFPSSRASPSRGAVASSPEEKETMLEQWTHESARKVVRRNARKWRRRHHPADEPLRFRRDRQAIRVSRQVSPCWWGRADVDRRRLAPSLGHRHRDRRPRGVSALRGDDRKVWHAARREHRVDARGKWRLAHGRSGSKWRRRIPTLGRVATGDGERTECEPLCVA